MEVESKIENSALDEEIWSDEKLRNSILYGPMNNSQNNPFFDAKIASLCPYFVTLIMYFSPYFVTYFK